MEKVRQCDTAEENNLNATGIILPKFPFSFSSFWY